MRMRGGCGDSESAAQLEQCVVGEQIARVRASIVATLPSKASTIGQLIMDQRTDRIHDFPRSTVTQVRLLSEHAGL